MLLELVVQALQEQLIVTIMLLELVVRENREQQTAITMLSVLVVPVQVLVLFHILLQRLRLAIKPIRPIRPIQPQRQVIKIIQRIQRIQRIQPQYLRLHILREQKPIRKWLTNFKHC